MASARSAGGGGRVAQVAHRILAPASLVVMGLAWGTMRQMSSKTADEIAELAPWPGAPQCSYEMLHSFARLARDCIRRDPEFWYTLGAGTLLGAMRNDPPGLLQWEHDVDVYVTARHAAHLLDVLNRSCHHHAESSGRGFQRVRQLCGVIDFRGLIDRRGVPCCAFGFKLYHRDVGRCGASELDILVLSAATSTWAHGETMFWPPWTIPWAWLWASLAGAMNSASHAAHSLYSTSSRQFRPFGTLPPRPAAVHFLVIPQDIMNKSLMSDYASRWCIDGTKVGQWQARPRRIWQGIFSARKERVVNLPSSEWTWCGGPPTSFFQDEYLSWFEVFPIQWVMFYDVWLPVPHDAWATLMRTYGVWCRNTARLDEHGGILADLRAPQHTRLRRPAKVQHLRWWTTRWRGP